MIMTSHSIHYRHSKVMICATYATLLNTIYKWEPNVPNSQTEVAEQSKKR